MKFLAAVAISFLIATNVFALSKDSIKPTFEQKVQQALKVLHNNSLDNDTKAQKLYKMFDPFFNYALMARLSLGSHWASLEEKQKNTFAKRFEEKLKNTYKDVLIQYEDEKIEFVSLKQPKSNRIYLTSKIHSDAEVYTVVYKFYQAGKDDWLIYDLNVLDVSIIQSFRNQFSAYENEGFDKLLSLLEKNSI